jgi:histone H3/H4
MRKGFSRKARKTLKERWSRLITAVAFDARLLRGVGMRKGFSRKARKTLKGRWSKFITAVAFDARLLRRCRNAEGFLAESAENAEREVEQVYNCRCF